MSAPDIRKMPWTFVLTEPLRILVVDDDPILREFASVNLSTPSTTIDTACDGVEARVRLGQTAYDMVLLDIEMPNLNGFSLLKEIRSNEGLRHLPVVMLTGHDDIASIDRAYQLGANSFATKPVNWRQLSYQIRYVIRMSRAELPQTRSHDPLPKSAAVPTAAMFERDVRNFFQSITNHADALERQLPVSDRARFLEQILAVREIARRAFTACSRLQSSAADCVDRLGVSDRRVGKAGGETVSVRWSGDVVDS